MAFPKEQRKVVTLTIEEDGDLTFLATDSADVFLEQGETITRRASHVEPVGLLLRVAFHLLRRFGTKNQIAAWTRTWPCEWRVNTKPVGGPVLTYGDIEPRYKHAPVGKRIVTWRNRQHAIDAEVAFLNEWFAERS
jgi:hypothetical protein